MSSLLKKFAKADLPLLEKVGKEAKTIIECLFNRGHADNLFIARLGYGTPVWADCKLQIDDKTAPNFSKPVGLVLQGALEVTERFAWGNASRLRTTKILRPGDFFGLFEAVGNLHGQWKITSGVQRFLVTNPLGNIKNLNKKGCRGFSEEQLLTLKHSTKATFDYSDLVQFAMQKDNKSRANDLKYTEDSWHTILILFDQGKVYDNEVKLYLYTEAVKQLVSLAKQNPTDALLDDNLAIRRENAEELRVAATVDAILADHIPIFGPYHVGHDAFGPFGKITECLKSLLTDDLTTAEGSPTQVHLWIPDYWSDIQKPGAFYFDSLAGRFDMEYVDKLFQVGHSKDRILRSGTRISKRNLDEHYAKVTTREKRSAEILRIKLNRKERRLSPEMHQEIFPANFPQECIYGWPPHLGKGLFFKK